MTIKRQREIIHDIANNFSVVDLNLSVVIRSLAAKYPDSTPELERLKKALENSSSAIDSLRELRTLVAQSAQE